MLRILALCYAAIATVAILLISEHTEESKEDDQFRRYEVDQASDDELNSNVNMSENSGLSN